MASIINRVKTGVPGMDKLMEGGIPEGSVVLLSGGAGCGKTTFSCQFIMEGLNNGENCLYITLEESPEDIKKDAL
ncbi:MAG: AAA family ATPase, partial [Candidatus Aenigmarchaeota archaeon]|nr:AAA family ATPase [Candidatus Aenigmarchaeota archaeon]